LQWVIIGETFEMTEVADWEKVKLNTTEKSGNLSTATMAWA